VIPKPPLSGNPTPASVTELRLITVWCASARSMPSPGLVRAFSSTRLSLDSSKHAPAGTPSPPIVWPFRSSVMSSAPITIPLPAQSLRSLSSFVSVLTIAPQPNEAVNAGAAADPIAAATANVATAAIVIAPIVRNRVMVKMKLL
jgi:hypothetical protein